MKKFAWLVLVILLKYGVGLAQTEQEVLVAFVPVFGASPLALETTFYKLDGGDSIRIETIKFYISGIELLKEEELVWKEDNSFHLVDAEVAASMHISLKVNPKRVWNQIRFRFGIDSITNVSGAMGGDLDPTKGMYWTWDNGYINAKIEGISNRCSSRKNEFQLHIGGYRNSISTSRVITLPVGPSGEMRLVLDLEPILNKIDLAKTHHIMSAGREAVSIAEMIAQNLKMN